MRLHPFSTFPREQAKSIDRLDLAVMLLDTYIKWLGLQVLQNWLSCRLRDLEYSVHMI